MSDKRIIIGIDFGTTYSGIGWKHTGQTGEGEVISMNRNSRTNVKVPTEILYDGLSDDEPRWGWDAQGNAGSLRYFKLELDEEQRAKVQRLFDLEDLPTPLNQYGSFDFTPFSHHIGTTVTLQQLPNQRTAIDVCTDYIGAIGNEATKTIANRFGDGILQATPTQYVLTVPAIWSDPAKNATKECARRAFGASANIELVAEPQAAAIYVLKSRHNIENLTKDTHYVVCDAGGGTVDLITYQVLNDNPLQLGESVRGTGDVCGALLLNKMFESYLATILGKYYGGGAGGKVMENAVQRIRKTFEFEIKRQFDNSGYTWEAELPFNVDFSDLPYVSDEKENTLLLRSSEIATKVFDPVIDRIIWLIKEQIDMVRQADRKAKIAGIMLVGGFGLNPYLRDRVKSAFVPEVAEVLQPPNAEVAVVSGALVWAEDMGTVTRQKVRRYYGQEISVDHMPGRPRTENSVTGKLTTQVMYWYVCAGQDVTDNPPNDKLECYMDVSKNPHLQITLLAWDPKPGNEQAPPVKDKDCYEVGELNLTFTPSDLRNFPRIRRQDMRGEYYIIKFTMQLIFTSDLVFRAVFTGGWVKDVRVKYD